MMYVGTGILFPGGLYSPPFSRVQEHGEFHLNQGDNGLIFLNFCQSVHFFKSKHWSVVLSKGKTECKENV